MEAWNKSKFSEGDVFGSWTVVGKSPDSKGQKTLWIVECECGRECLKPSSDLNKIAIKGKGRCKSCYHLHMRGKNNHKWKGHKDISHRYWSSLIDNAKSRNIKFDISVEYVWSLYLKQNKKCALSNLPIDFSWTRVGKTRTQTASLDRINSSMGYTAGNVQWTHKTFNMMKRSQSIEDFFENCCRVADFYRKKARTT